MTTRNDICDDGLGEAEDEEPTYSFLYSCKRPL